MKPSILIRTFAVVLVLGILPACTSLSREEQRAEYELRIGKLRIEMMELLRSSTNMTLFSLKWAEEPKAGPRPLKFHQYQILGSTKLIALTNRMAIVTALNEATARTNIVAPACFDPQHGLRAQTREGEFDLVICFKCSKIHIHSKKQGEWGTKIGSSAAPVFDRILTEAGVPLSKETDE